MTIASRYVPSPTVHVLLKTNLTPDLEVSRNLDLVQIKIV